MKYENLPQNIFEPELVSQLETAWSESGIQEPFFVENKTLDKGINEKALRLLDAFPKRLIKRTKVIINAFYEVTDSLGAEDEIVENNIFNILAVLYDADKLVDREFF